MVDSFENILRQSISDPKRRALISERQDKPKQKIKAPIQQKPNKTNNNTNSNGRITQNKPQGKPQPEPKKLTPSQLKKIKKILEEKKKKSFSQKIAQRLKQKAINKRILRKGKRLVVKIPKARKEKLLQDPNRFFSREQFDNSKKNKGSIFFR